LNTIYRHDLFDGGSKLAQSCFIKTILNEFVNKDWCRSWL